MSNFIGAIAHGWIRGSIPKPPTSSCWFDPTYVHPVYKGEMLVRYWYFIAPAMICFVLAFAFAELPNKQPQVALQSLTRIF